MIKEFSYWVGWRSSGSQPGQHVGNQSDGGADFLGVSPLIEYPDPRHLDIRASLTDVHGQLLVKRFRQRTAIPVALVADLSASMGFQGTTRKTDLLAEFAEAVAWSAWRAGDPFAFFGCDDTIRWDLHLPLRMYKGLAADWLERLARFQPEASDARGLLEVAAHLGRTKSLVFLASDFHLPDDPLQRVLDSFSRHDLVPIVFWDSAEYQCLPRFGLVRLRDPETGAQRSLFLRPALRDRLQLAFRERRLALSRLCTRYGREPFFVTDRFDADALTRYFFET